MKRTDFSTIACSISRSAAVVGDPWSLLVVRDVALGLQRFDELQRDLGVATNVLTDRLARLVAGGILTRVLYAEGPSRYEYVLTDKGRDLVPILFALTAWGDRWEAGSAGPPLRILHRTCGNVTTAVVSCPCCDEALDLTEVDFLPGPGGRTQRGTALVHTKLRTFKDED